MFIDRNVLKLIYKVEDEAELDQVEKDYAFQLEQLTYEVLLHYLSTPEIPKPRLKPLVELSQRINDPNFKIEDPQHKLLVDQVLIAVNISPLFQSMVKETTDKFNNDLLEDGLAQMNEGDIDTLLKYLEDKASSMQKNLETVKKIGDRLNEPLVAFSR